MSGPLVVTEREIGAEVVRSTGPAGLSGRTVALSRTPEAGPELRRRDVILSLKGCIDRVLQVLLAISRKHWPKNAFVFTSGLVHNGGVPGEVEGRFRAHSHYVEAFGWLAGKTTFTLNETALEAVAARVRASGANTDKCPAAIDFAQVHKSLRNAWSTEVLLALPGEWAKDEDEFMRLSNTWGVIQAYYVGYHATQALVVAKGMRRPTSHPITQQQYATLWADRSLELPPWTFGVSHGGWRNKSEAATIDPSVHPWSTCSATTCWSLAARALKSTRDEVVKKSIKAKRDDGQRQRRKAWEEDERNRLARGLKPRALPRFGRPQLDAAAKAACSKRIRTYTILDYLYRLRIGANYDDAAVFTDGPDNDIDSYLLHKRISFLASGLALISEMRVRELVGRTRFYKWADAFVATNIPQGYFVGIKERRNLL